MIKIKINGTNNLSIEKDGEPIEGVRSLQFNVGVEQLPNLELNMTTSIELELSEEVQTVCCIGKYIINYSDYVDVIEPLLKKLNKV